MRASPSANPKPNSSCAWKTIEYRSRPTRIIGEAFYIYAARTPGVAEELALLDCQPGDFTIGLPISTWVRDDAGNQPYANFLFPASGDRLRNALHR